MKYLTEANECSKKGFIKDSLTSLNKAIEIYPEKLEAIESKSNFLNFKNNNLI
jgi:hypothetical protein